MPHTSDHSFGQARSIVESVVTKREIGFLGWRIVPTDSSVLDDKAAATQPNIRQVLLNKPFHLTPDQYEHTLYVIRGEIEQGGAGFEGDSAHRTIAPLRNRSSNNFTASRYFTASRILPSLSTI